MSNNWLLLIPLLTALTGLLCARLPFTLLLHPVKPVRFLGFTFQGVLPAARATLASEAGLFISRQFSLDGLEQKINDPSNFEKIRPMIEVHIDEFLRVKLKEQMPMISMFIGDKTIVSLKEVFIKEIGELFPKIIGQFAGNLKNEFNVQAMATEKIAAIDMSQATAAIEKKMARPLRMIAITGFLVGLAVGIIQLLIVLAIA
ncbi:MAG: DUF445 domain-containing protein [Chitinophagaceae bacterium]|nr:MAG: DUF445 domain-containing protein [Chitinophagaceae bacterium]